MWARSSISVLTLIAVHTQKLETLRKVIFDEPRINSFISIVRFSLNVPVIIDVIYSQEKRLGLSATSASAAKTS